MCPHCLAEMKNNDSNNTIDTEESEDDIDPDSLLQIRRYVYRNVVRVVDISRHIDVSEIQTHFINGAKAVFINTRDKEVQQHHQNSQHMREKKRKQRELDNVNEASSSSPSSSAQQSNRVFVCFACSRALQPPFQFCSIECKVKHNVKIGVWHFKGLNLPERNEESKGKEEEKEERKEAMIPNQIKNSNTNINANKNYIIANEATLENTAGKVFGRNVRKNHRKGIPRSAMHNVT